MVKVGIVRGATAFLPEVEAYTAAFGAELDVEVTVVTDEKIPPDCDVVIIFCGLVPFWRSFPGRIVTEYHSLSAGRLGRVKDIIKRIVNVRGDHYIFLSDTVRKEFMFSIQRPHSIRGMGYDPELARRFAGGSKEYDFAYCGSVRSGVIERIERLSELGFSVAVAGAVGKDHARLASNTTGRIHSHGRVSLEASYEIMGRATYGFSFTPDVHPWNIQDSTKIIEYLGMGLKVVSNRYNWLESFEADSGARILDIDAIAAQQDVESFEFRSGDIERWAWPTVIARSGIVDSVLGLVR